MSVELCPRRARPYQWRAISTTVTSYVSTVANGRCRSHELAQGSEATQVQVLRQRIHDLGHGAEAREPVQPEPREAGRRSRLVFLGRGPRSHVESCPSRIEYGPRSRIEHFLDLASSFIELTSPAMLLPTSLISPFTWLISPGSSLRRVTYEMEHHNLHE